MCGPGYKTPICQRYLGKPCCLWRNNLPQNIYLRLNSFRFCSFTKQTKLRSFILSEIIRIPYEITQLGNYDMNFLPGDHQNHQKGEGMKEG